MEKVPVENVEGNFIFHLMFKELFDRDRLLGDETHVHINGVGYRHAFR